MACAQGLARIRMSKAPIGVLGKDAKGRQGTEDALE
jgi:hypothetical protein